MKNWIERQTLLNRSQLHPTCFFCGERAKYGKGGHHIGNLKKLLGLPIIFCQSCEPRLKEVRELLKD
jgi:hypothetical protein